jgi:hypothetical protein
MPRGDIAAGTGKNLPIKRGDLLAHCVPYDEQRFDNRGQHIVAGE